MERNEAFVFLSLSITGQAGTRKWLFMFARKPANRTLLAFNRSLVKMT